MRMLSCRKRTSVPVYSSGERYVSNTLLCPTPNRVDRMTYRVARRLSSCAPTDKKVPRAMSSMINFCFMVPVLE